MLSKIFDVLIGDIPVEQRKAFMRVLFRGVFAVHIVWACGWLGTIGLNGFAQAGEVQKVREELTQQLDDVKAQVKRVDESVSRSQRLSQRTSMETEIRRLDQEIFNIEARVKELTAAGLRADRIYDERLSDLRSQRDRVESRLTAFMRANTDLVGATF